MALRQVVTPLCRSAATASSRISPTSSSLACTLSIHARSHFTTDSSKQSGAAAAAAAPSQPNHPPTPPTTTTTTSPAQNRLNQLRPLASVPLPPRPPPIRSTASLDASSSARKRTTGFSSPWTAPKGPSSSIFPSPPSSSTTNNPTTTGITDWDLPSEISGDMNRTLSPYGSLSTWDEGEFRERHALDESKMPELRLRPPTGRTIPVTGRVDVARAFRLLERTVLDNGVRNDFYAQRFHERPALKRKRLLRERWRKRFKHGFYSAIKRVVELKAQGW
ncbi:hypothetical protein VTJ04DRAFT_5075 [Mycothermus thermophilus]|uniref:mitochondrial 37S ribosomal protein bS21m n=1 Tax=Humicola insolens TaxID=85995 RepID=UPI003742F95F